jgi:hypothetical protein
MSEIAVMRSAAHGVDVLLEAEAVAQPHARDDRIALPFASNARMTIGFVVLEL